MKKIQNTYLKISCFCYLLTFSIFITNAHAISEYTLTSAPKWITISTYDAVKKLEDSQSTQYLLLDRQLNTVSADQHYYFRTVMRPLNSTGVTEASEMF